MIDLILATSNSLFFLALALVHLNWLLGGSWASYILIPTDGNNRLLYKPSGGRAATICIGLLCFTLINLTRTGMFGDEIARDLAGYGIAGIATILLLRAIGDFAYIGFTKRFNNSQFSRSDTRIFSPACLLVSLSHFALL